MAKHVDLHELAARGQSIWFDTLSRRSRPHGRAEEDDEGRRRHRRHLEPVDLPEGALGRRRVRRADLKKLLEETDDRERDLLRARARGHPRRLRRAEAGLRRVERRRRLRLDGGRARDRLRHRADLRAGALDRDGGRPAEPDGEDPGDDARPAGDRGLHRARHVDQHHADLLARALQGRRRGIPARSRAARRERRRPVEDRVRRVVLRLARRHRGRQAPRGARQQGAAGQARDREREARVRALPRGVLRARAGSSSRARAPRSSGASGRRRRRRTPTTAT